MSLDLAVGNATLGWGNGTGIEAREAEPEKGTMPAPAPTAAVDVVDERNEPIGTAQRREVLPQGLNFRTVHILVFDKHDEVLLQRLNPSRDRHPRAYGSSVAGYLHAGETYEAAATRRLREELGVTAPLDFVGVTPMDDENSTKFIGVFRVELERNHPENHDPEQIAALEWFPIRTLVEALAAEPFRFTPSLIHVIRFLASEGIPSSR